jgi:xanthine dehydrogenase accessory factor
MRDSLVALTGDGEAPRVRCRHGPRRPQSARARVSLLEGSNAMKDVIEDVDRWIERGDKVALATVVGVRRSAPRPPGAKMAINDKGEISGMVSGGCVEGAVIEIADGIIKGDDPQLLTFGITDDMAFDVGLPCGGEIDVWIERFES